MSRRIEDYALIGDTRTAALVGRDGSIDWLCLPRFDSAACFAALVGTPDNGRWRMHPEEPVVAVERRYRGDTLVLETSFETEGGRVTLIDLMDAGEAEAAVSVVRIVRGDAGAVRMEMELIVRFDYGSIVPWVTRDGEVLRALAGPDAVSLRCPVEPRGEDLATRASFTVRAGERVPFVLWWQPSHEPPAEAPDAEQVLERSERWWRGWSARHADEPAHCREPVTRSLITLKALTYAPTGGIVAAPTTSLPERIGGERNWDYRFCWVRDATFTLYAMLLAGHREEAEAWRAWLLRAVAGEPRKLQILYGLAGERRLDERELPWLDGYEGSRPVRTGNAAHTQVQLDTYGELMDVLHVARREGLDADAEAWALQRAVLDFLETAWEQPDAGLWEMRGPPRRFTHSRMMTWVAFDRAVKAVERHGLEGPVERWRTLRDRIHADVCTRGFHEGRNAFVQSYEGEALDASLLMMPMVGFLPADDPRVIGTVEAIRRDLTVDGLVLRYRTDEAADGLAGEEGVFLPCSFWLADNLAMMGRREEARELFDHLLGLRNDVGLLAEEYDPLARRLLGNYPQAFSHVALVNTAHNLHLDRRPAHERAR